MCGHLSILSRNDLWLPPDRMVSPGFLKGACGIGTRGFWPPTEMGPCIQAPTSTRGCFSIPVSNACFSIPPGREGDTGGLETQVPSYRVPADTQGPPRHASGC